MKKRIFAALLALVLAAWAIGSAQAKEMSSGYDMMGEISEGMAAVRKDGLWGYINTSGALIIGYKYARVAEFCEGLAAVRQDRKTGFIDRTGKTVVPFVYDEAENFSEGVAVVCKDGLYGVVDTAGKLVVPMEYTRIYSASDGRLLAVKGGKYGYLSLDGKVAVDFIYSYAESFSDGVALVKDIGFKLIYNNSATVVALSYQDVSVFQDGYAVVCGYNARYGVINKAGEVVLPVEYLSVTNLGSGRMYYISSAQRGYFIAATRQYASYAKYPVVELAGEGLQAAQNTDGLWGYLKAGTEQEVGSFAYSYAGKFSEGLAVVGKDGLYGYVNAAGKLIVSCQYDEAREFKDGVAVVRSGRNYGLISQTGEVVTGFVYASVGAFEDGYAVVKRDGYYYLYHSDLGGQDSWVSAAASVTRVYVNGKEVPIKGYLIGGNNYFKLRDVAAAISGTTKGFEVTWKAADSTITITKGSTYTPVGGELTGSTYVSLAKKNPVKLFIGGVMTPFSAYLINSNNYFKLRDLGQEFNFGVTWDAATRSIYIDTASNYTEG